MTKVEKVVLGIILVAILQMAFTVGYLTTRPDGWFREAIIETGKEVKQVYREINEN